MTGLQEFRTHICSLVAHLLIDARRHQRRIADIPATLKLYNEYEAYEIQRLVTRDLGAIGGFKVGASGPDAPPACAPMMADGIHDSPAYIDAAPHHRVESEIAFKIGQDLPPRDQAYTRADILAAIASCHAGVEILATRFDDTAAPDTLLLLADHAQHGAFVVGDGVPDWQRIDFTRLRVRQCNGDQVTEATGNPAGDMVRLVQWLANDGAHAYGGLRAGHIVTCGSWTGSSRATGDVSAEFDGFRPVSLGWLD